MAWIVRLVSLGAEGAEHSTDVLQIANPGDLTDLASLGLTLAEGKQLLAGLQQEIVAAQARVHAARRPDCHGCGTACGVKDYRQHAIATLFGQVTSGCPASVVAAVGRARLAWVGRRTPARRRSWTGCGRSSPPC